MRNIRRSAKEAIEKMEKDGHVGKDAQLPPMKRNVDSVVITVTI